MNKKLICVRGFHWIVGTAITLASSTVSAQSGQVPDMFGQAAKTLDQFRLQQSVGILGMVIFSMMAGVALAMRKLAIGFGAMFLVLASYVWYSDIARTMMTTSGTPYAP